MVDGGKLFVQLLRIVFGFIAAMLAAALFISWGYFQTTAPSDDPVAFAAMIWSSFVAASIFGGLSFIPAGIAIIIAEAFKWRSPLIHMGAGGLIAIGLWTLGGQMPDAELEYALRPGSNIAMAAGFIAGFVYWLFAGRKSGYWRIQPKAE
ncbi:translation initiation factor IF-3 [Rhodobacteraceae bacterium RKSG542]|uniref:translation initiation factor IF-3 n=1 Tax=Pseudovibrio flavus TaxID=2529854 RepID=UPI0012BCB22B|nr:translation initiation factor IF-3 [Pseudovibrio flavus]MTI18344.1 translation initiation factor IF-3 [Pseudovibrio flavus]